MSKTDFEILFIIDSGIGNALEALYSVEYCLKNEIKAGIFLNNISRSFQKYVQQSYGDEVFVSSVEGLKTKHLVHSFTCYEKFDIEFENYFYIDSNFLSAKYQSETELYLSLVRALYPSDYNSFTLNYLKENYSERVRALQIENKTLLYPGSRLENSVKRWQHFEELMQTLGKENVIFVGTHDDGDFRNMYIYPPWVVRLLPQKILNRQQVWAAMRSLGLLKAQGHFRALGSLPNTYFNHFDWAELVAIFRHCKNYVGNDGGLSHLAAAVGCKGLVIFGPTSIEKNRSFSPTMKEIALKYPCQPCQFGAGGIPYTKYMINCPFQKKCLNDIGVKQIVAELQKL